MITVEALINITGSSESVMDGDIGERRVEHRRNL